MTPGNERPAGHAGVVAIIPARGSSKGIPRKNLLPVGGVPLVTRAVRAALAVPQISATYVSTDDDEIAAVADRAGAQVITRPPELAADTSTSESAILHGLDVLESSGVQVDVVVMLQATSPFIDTDALSEAVTRVRDGSADVVFAAFPTHGFLWRETENGAEGVNHDPSYRPRRQDLEPQFQESGAFYVMNAPRFRSAGHRFFGTVRVQETDPLWSIEVDTPDDLHRAAIIAPGDPYRARPRLDRVRALVTDFDGVHTDDTATVDQDGRESVTVSRSDGLGIAALRARGLPVLILSKERNPVVAARAAKLGVDVLQGVDDKEPALRSWAEEREVDLADIAYVGNDLTDLGCLAAVGYSVAVADAHPTVIAAASIVLTRRGGRGAVREVAELILGVDSTEGEQ